MRMERARNNNIIPNVDLVKFEVFKNTYWNNEYAQIKHKYIFGSQMWKRLYKILQVPSKDAL